MQNETFEPGQELYLENGNLVEYITPALHGHVVRDIYEDSYGGDVGEPFFVERVFTNPPRAKREEMIVELDAEIDKRQERLAEISREIIDVERERTRLANHLKQNEVLREIDAVLSGKITHAAIILYNKIEVCCFSDRARSWFGHPITLRLTGDNTFKWVMEKYPPRTCDRECHPFTSREDAVAFAKEWVQEQATKEVRDNQRRGELIRMAKEFGAVLPESFHNDYNAEIKAQVEAKRKEAQAELDKATKALAELGGGDDA